MAYCYKCGTKLIDREHEHEGLIPYCEKCGEYRYPVFSTACSMIVLNPKRDKILLIKQYGKNRNVLVAGYINKGENAEAAVAREVMEEIGIEVKSISYNKSEYFEPSNTLMLNFTCVAESEDLSCVNCDEVDSAEWFDFKRARINVMHNSVAERFLLFFLDNSIK